MALEALRVAVCILQEASAADMAGDVDRALLLYVSAQARFETLMPNLPSEHAEVLQQHLDGIRQRADALRGEKNRKKATSSGEYPKFPVAFQYQSIPLEEGRHAVPHAVVLRPYWLMRTLSKSMQGGAFITPDLYVSKDVWYQEGATAAVTYLGPKVRFLSHVCEAVEPLLAVTTLNEPKKVLKALDQFIAVAEQIKTTFDAEVGRTKTNDGIAQRSKIERGVWEFIHRGQTMLKSWKHQQDASYNVFLAWSVNVLEQAQLLDRWTQYFLEAPSTSSGSEILDRLHNISAFMYFSICSFLIQDMMTLVERYMEKSRESVSRFMPVDVRIEQ